MKLRALRAASGRLDGRLDRLPEVVRTLAGGAQRQRRDQLARAMPLEDVVDRDPGPAALPYEVVATVGCRDEVLGHLRPANSSERLELGELELALGLHAGILDRAGVDGADT